MSDVPGANENVSSRGETCAAGTGVADEWPLDLAGQALVAPEHGLALVLVCQQVRRLGQRVVA